MQRKKVVAGYLKSEQLLLFVFAALQWLEGDHGAMYVIANLEKLKILKLYKKKNNIPPASVFT